MSTNIFNPSVIDKANDLLLGEGVVYKDLDEVTETAIGATAGGSKLEVEWEKLQTKYDGSMGPTKGMRRTGRFVPKLTVNLLKINYTNIVYGLNVTVSDGSDQDGTYKKISFDTDFASTDVLTNIGFKGYKGNGKYCKIKVENALNINALSFEFKEKGEIKCEMVYTGFFAYSAPTTPPLSIREEV